LRFTVWHKPGTAIFWQTICISFSNQTKKILDPMKTVIFSLLSLVALGNISCKEEVKTPGQVMSDQISAKTKPSVTKANVYEWTEQSGYQEVWEGATFKLHGQYIVFSSPDTNFERYYNMDKMMSFIVADSTLYCYFK
jgi:hypothetical protein